MLTEYIYITLVAVPIYTHGPIIRHGRKDKRLRHSIFFSALLRMRSPSSPLYFCFLLLVFEAKIDAHFRRVFSYFYAPGLHRHHCRSFPPPLPPSPQHSTSHLTQSQLRVFHFDFWVSSRNIGIKCETLYAYRILYYMWKCVLA